MNTTNSSPKASLLMRLICPLRLKIILLGILILVASQTVLQAQDSIRYSRPAWRFGLAAGVNNNFYRGSTQELNPSLTIPSVFHNGYGFGRFIAPLIEYAPADKWWGVMLQAGYDSRRGTFTQIKAPCNCPADLDTDLGYITVEPSVRISPFKSNLYLYGGPRLAFNVSNAFTYQLGQNPAYPNQAVKLPLNGNFDNMNDKLISMQIGAGYDFRISSRKNRTQTLLSPFVSFQPYFGQNPRSIETWNLTTLRIGAAIKIGNGNRITLAKTWLPTLAPKFIEPVPELRFWVDVPIHIEPMPEELFPLRNYVFFDAGSTQIPVRYIALSPDKAKRFNEDQLQLFIPNNKFGRSERQMKVYYNVLNILGSRMVAYPSTKIRLIGSSESGANDGLEMSSSIRQYLVKSFDISVSRIEIEGRTKPDVPSVQVGATRELILLREGDRRVSIETVSPELLMEFQLGDNTIYANKQSNKLPADRVLTFNIEGANNSLSFWTLEAQDQTGKVQSFGPFKDEKVSIAESTILGANTDGSYKLTMIAKTKEVATIRKEADANLKLWIVPKAEEVMRFSVIYEFNKSQVLGIYQKYLEEVVVPKIPNGATVVIHGHTDIIGSEAHNLKLSVARATNIKTILGASLKKVGKNDVGFKLEGFGENETAAPFANKYPEERFYNRTVIIDIEP